MSGQCLLCCDVFGLATVCSGGDNCFFKKYGLREKMMEDNEYLIKFKNLMEKVYHRSVDEFRFHIQLTCDISNKSIGAEVAAMISAAQISAAQAAASAAQAAASAAQAAASAAQASATVADQDAAAARAEVVNESAAMRFWNKTKTCLGHAIKLLVICTAAAGACT